MTTAWSASVRPAPVVRQIGQVLSSALRNNPAGTLPALLSMGVAPVDILGGSSSVRDPDHDPSIWRVVVETGDAPGIALLLAAMQQRRARMTLAARRHETSVLIVDTLSAAMGGILPAADPWEHLCTWSNADHAGDGARVMWQTLADAMTAWFDRSLPTPGLAVPWIRSMRSLPGGCPDGWWEPNAPGGGAVRAALLRRHADALVAWVTHGGRSAAPAAPSGPWHSLLHQAWGCVSLTADADAGPFDQDDEQDWILLDALLDVVPHSGDPSYPIPGPRGVSLPLGDAVLAAAQRTTTMAAARIVARQRLRPRRDNIPPPHPRAGEHKHRPA